MSSIDRYAVIGELIGHSQSPRIHTLFAAATRQEMRYALIDVGVAGFAGAVREFFSGGGRGLNVTVPHKHTALQLADTLTPRARRAGAVNTLARGLAGTTDTSVLGDNTDGAGLVRDLTINLGFKLRGARLLLLGAGGAARGIIAPLLEAGAASLAISNRHGARAQELAQEFADLGPVRAAPNADGRGAAPYDLIINATSASLRGELPLISAATVGTQTLCYDCAYAEHDTVFMTWARGAGAARAVMGLGMLVEQAAESFLLWRGLRPDTAPVLAALQAPAGE
ncbi:MAG TPA: shikimate dehydrogenase [Steroidobacteraceae bacterium]|jgi:shikimate dehydrogenase|nr:shikimate dehydrogenase [Steroidobacteraceae bacterium]